MYVDRMNMVLWIILWVDTVVLIWLGLVIYWKMIAWEAMLWAAHNLLMHNSSNTVSGCSTAHSPPTFVVESVLKRAAGLYCNGLAVLLHRSAFPFQPWLLFGLSRIDRNGIGWGGGCGRLVRPQDGSDRGVRSCSIIHPSTLPLCTLESGLCDVGMLKLLGHRSMPLWEQRMRLDDVVESDLGI